MMDNRLRMQQPDYLLIIVRRPNGFRPRNHFEEPSPGRLEVVEITKVASYEEAYEDLVRCNRLSLHRSLDTWALIQKASAGSTS